MVRLGLGVVLALASVSVAACSAAEDNATSDALPNDIIGGVDATSAEFNAVGMLAFRGNDGNGSNCTGTLIAPSIVLTAKHCVMDKPSEEGSGFRLAQGKVYFVVGQNGHHPLGAIEATAVETSAIFHGGYTGLGSDVALYTLKTPITTITPLAVSATPPSAADVNAPFIAIGYGTQDAVGTSGTRKTGAVTIRTVNGQPAHAAFSTVEAYVASQTAMVPAGTTITDAQLEGTRKHYDAPLSNDYEVYVGGPSAGEVQICHGDSGGPLLRRDNGKLVVYGVASTTFGQTGKLCRDGSMYAVFGASTRDIIANAVGDHCAAAPKTGALTCGLAAAPTSCVSIQGDGTPPADGTTPEPLSTFAQCLATECCSETTACFSNTECSALSACFRGCGAAGTDAATTTACNTACYQARSGEYTRYLAYQICGKKNCSTATAPATPATATPPATP